MITDGRFHAEMVHEYHEKGKIDDAILKKFYEKLPILGKAIIEVEHASKLSYPKIIFDPALSILRFNASTSGTVIYASTRIHRFDGTYQLCVSISLPFLLYSTEEVLRACLVHELLHHIYTTIVLSRRSFMSLASQRLDAPEVFLAFDETHTVDPNEWIYDQGLIDLMNKVFRPMIEDRDLISEIKEYWVGKGFPVRYLTSDESKVRVPVTEVSKIALDPEIIARAKNKRLE
ncbi:MAG: hypothetical protein NO516_02810 [Candidatus Methanomethylicia archaeon]|nr:hypothetical protein [Candidatus Methanomethylicia archaeon]